jgi:hypothetical protein
LLEATYIRKGAPYNTVRLHGTPDNDPYNPEIMKSHYENHNREVIQYFENRPNDLLIINVAHNGDWQRLLDFIGATSTRTSFPWENKT